MSEKQTQLRLADRIRELRESKGWSKADFARKINEDRQNVGRYEKPGDPKLCSLIKIAKAFNISISELFKGV